MVAEDEEKRKGARWEVGRVQWSVMAEDEKRKGDGRWGGYSGQ